LAAAWRRLQPAASRMVVAGREGPLIWSASTSAGGPTDVSNSSASIAGTIEFKRPKEMDLFAKRFARGLAALLLAGFLTGVAVEPSFAQEGKLPPATVAIIDVERVFRESAAGKSALEQIKAQQKKYQSKFDADEAALEKEREQIQQQKTILAPEVWEQKVTKFRERTRELQQESNAKTAQLNRADIEFRRKLQPVLRQIASEIIQEVGANIAIDRSAALIFAQELDITDRVITKLDEELPEIEISFEDPKASKTN
jgi:Skp family chaperone for outer membrane proteins